MCLPKVGQAAFEFAFALLAHALDGGDQDSGCRLIPTAA